MFVAAAPAGALTSGALVKRSLRTQERNCAQHSAGCAHHGACRFATVTLSGLSFGRTLTRNGSRAASRINKTKGFRVVAAASAGEESSQQNDFSAARANQTNSETRPSGRRSNNRNLQPRSRGKKDYYTWRESDRSRADVVALVHDEAAFLFASVQDARDKLLREIQQTSAKLSSPKEGFLKNDTKTVSRLWSAGEAEAGSSEDDSFEEECSDATAKKIGRGASESSPDVRVRNDVVGDKTIDVDEGRRLAAAFQVNELMNAGALRSAIDAEPPEIMDLRQRMQEESSVVNASVAEIRKRSARLYRQSGNLHQNSDHYRCTSADLGEEPSIASANAGCVKRPDAAAQAASFN